MRTIGVVGRLQLGVGALVDAHLARRLEGDRVHQGCTLTTTAPSRGATAADEEDAPSRHPRCARGAVRSLGAVDRSGAGHPRDRVGVAARPGSGRRRPRPAAPAARLRAARPGPDGLRAGLDGDLRRHPLPGLRADRVVAGRRPARRGGVRSDHRARARGRRPGRRLRSPPARADRRGRRRRRGRGPARQRDAARSAPVGALRLLGAAGRLHGGAPPAARRAHPAPGGARRAQGRLGAAVQLPQHGLARGPGARRPAHRRRPA